MVPCLHRPPIIRGLIHEDGSLSNASGLYSVPAVFPSIGIHETGWLRPAPFPYHWKLTRLRQSNHWQPGEGCATGLVFEVPFAQTPACRVRARCTLCSTIRHDGGADIGRGISKLMTVIASLLHERRRCMGIQFLPGLELLPFGWARPTWVCSLGAPHNGYSNPVHTHPGDEFVHVLFGIIETGLNRCPAGMFAATDTQRQRPGVHQSRVVWASGWAIAHSAWQADRERLHREL